MAYTNIDDPSAFFQTALYTGNGSHPRNITNDGNSDLKPDFLWLKKRNQAGTNHVLANSSIGWDAPKGQGYSWEDGPFGGQMASDSTGAESIPAATYGYVSAALTDGFTAAAGGTNGDTVNQNGKTFVAWQWKANGGTTASNTDGSITSTVQANQDAGFSIVTYTAPSSTGNFTAGHGLGVKPDMVITKSRSATGGWWIWHKDLAQPNYYIGLHSTGAQAFASNMWGAGFDTSTIGLNVTASGQASATYIAYCFAEKQGYSKFGKYVGNGSADGPFVYTGFKPAFLMVKNISGGVGNWTMYDNKRAATNLNNKKLAANISVAENDSAQLGGDANGIDFLSNGFKIRLTGNNHNVSAATYIYMAFAENPFVTSTGVPTTAR